MIQELPLAGTKSRFESLPVEIIQEIFLRCLELNLPRASIHIARALSNPTIYTWLIRLAFSRTAKGFEEPFITPEFIPLQIGARRLDRDERRNLRTLILRCRWCTLPLMRKCQREFIESVIHSECQGLDFSPEDSDILANIPSRFDCLEDYDRAQDGRRGKADLILRSQTRQPKFQQSKPTYQVSIWFALGAVQISEAGAADPKGSYFELPFCEGSELPDKLLSPPWTEPKLEFLELLSTRACIDQDSSYPRASRALRQLIRNRDFATFDRLLGLHVRVPYYRFPIPWPVLRVHFQAALKHADERDDPFVRLLVNKRWDNLPAHDIQLKDKLLAKLGPKNGYL